MMCMNLEQKIYVFVHYLLYIYSCIKYCIYIYICICIYIVLEREAIIRDGVKLNIKKQKEK